MLLESGGTDRQSQRALVERLSKLAENATARLRVRSALNPILWLALIAAVTCIPLALAFEGVLQTVIVCAGITPIGVACICYVVFMFRDPDRLHSEDYQLRKQALEMVQEKGSPIKVEVTSIAALANPFSREIGSSEEGHS